MIYYCKKPTMKIEKAKCMHIKIYTSQHTRSIENEGSVWHDFQPKPQQNNAKTYSRYDQPKNSKNGTTKVAKPQNNVDDNLKMDGISQIVKLSQILMNLLRKQNKSFFKFGQKYDDDDENENEDRNTAPFSQNIVIIDAMLKDIQNTLKEIRMSYGVVEDITNVAQTKLIKKYQY
ncbi:hypothetical protein TTHERM_00630370 (macronuclear) [Tetrahymena thermophila SB210]|uniref:Uncharacterized protein n=1 Tax=Tetrahymena thermophila (strain SB210) TaxID=312017 RepID=Q241Q3_TETTS|nr:hypothetical protein TTHERM_00630370 [Tetrahymena thermophila SB210]EAS02517.2 hypothetical protein TTHERM_00630370 [Tetrahymena thermophila SB210]|eukprot:XP_001022762.2 hypothetical protein TTHERM_00630370 [Tetrahymena thermophila SB210]